MKIISHGPKKNRTWHIEVSGNFLFGRWSFIKLIEKMPQTIIERKSIFSSWFKDEPFLYFRYKNISYIACMELIAGNSFLIMPEPDGFKEETKEIELYLKQL